MPAQIVNFRPSGDQSWAQEAACGDAGYNLMFPHETDKDGVDYAVAVCNQCPVRQACLDGAMDRNEAFGIWGGKTTAQRRELKKRNQKAAARKRRADAKAEADAARTPDTWLAEYVAASGLAVEDVASLDSV